MTEKPGASLVQHTEPLQKYANSEVHTLPQIHLKAADIHTHVSAGLDFSATADAVCNLIACICFNAS